MLKSIYNYFFGEEEQKIETNDILILKKSININNMNKLPEDSYKISLNN